MQEKLPHFSHRRQEHLYCTSPRSPIGSDTMNFFLRPSTLPCSPPLAKHHPSAQPEFQERHDTQEPRSSPTRPRTE
jgi:hypothetical protein